MGTPEFAPRKFSIRESQGDRSVCMCSNEIISIVSFFVSIFLVSQEEKESFEKRRDVNVGQFVNPIDDPSKTLPQAKGKVLQHVDTFFYIGTEV